METPILHEQAFNFVELLFEDGCHWYQSTQATYMVLYVMEGEMKIEISGKEYRAAPGELIYVPKEAKALQFHYIGRPYHGFTLRFRDFPGVEYFDYPTQTIALTDEMCALIEAIPTTQRVTEEKIWKFYRFLAHLQPKLIAGNQKHIDTVRTAIAYMNEHDRYTIETLARVCCVSVSGFCAIFKEVTGHTMLEDKYRIQAYKAEILLRTTDLSIDEIARKVGFASTQHFYKVFRTRYNLTPEKLRRTPTALYYTVPVVKKQGREPTDSDSSQ